MCVCVCGVGVMVGGITVVREQFKTHVTYMSHFSLCFPPLATSFRAEVKQEQQRLNLLTQQLTSSTQEASELEMKVELLKNQLAQAKETLKTKQNRIGRLQKEVGTH